MSPELKEVHLRQARATSEDLDATMNILAMLEDVMGCGFPRDWNGKHDARDPEEFEPENLDHLREFHNRLTTAIRRAPGAMQRVIYGMSTLCNPANELIDLEKDYLAPHPSTLKPVFALAELWNGLKLAMDQVVNDIARDSGTQAARIKPVLDSLLAKYETESEVA